MERVHVDGRETVGLMLYALSTCGWCKKTKALLDELGLAYDYLYINDLEGEAKEQARTEVMQWNPNCNFPTLVVGGARCIVGYREDEIRKLAEHE